jgi:uncharacterized protein YutE (UPF0331/DUF86 family)
MRIAAKTKGCPPESYITSPKLLVKNEILSKNEFFIALVMY